MVGTVGIGAVAALGAGALAARVGGAGPTRAVGSPLDPSSGEARRWLDDELASGYGTSESLLRVLLRQAVDWFFELFEGGRGTAISRWWMVLFIAIALVLLALVAWALLRLQPRRRAAAARASGVFDEEGVSAQEYRRRAEAARAAGDHATAVVDGYRALAAGAVERFILDDLPGATAVEIAQALGSVFPSEWSALSTSSALFGAVRYGQQRVGADDADLVLGLERRLRDAEPAPGPGALMSPGAQR
ncbi:MAG: DUF4129 domain-containing protein [Actinomycetia bacterium]|nr:DUF4129 domain-containing protein [Actinomycetes bacterium]